MSDYSEIYSCVKARGDRDPGFMDLTRQICRKNARYARFLQYPFACLSQKNLEAECFFIGSRLSELLLSLPREKVQVVGSPLDWKFCQKHKISFCSSTGAWPVVAKGIKSLGEEKKAVKLLDRFVDEFNGYGDGVVVTWSDGPPLERLLLLAARKRGLKTICVQHGIFARNYDNVEVDGKYADFTFAFDEYQKQLLIDKGVPEDRVRVMGFHSTLPGADRFPVLRSEKDRKVCFLGQPYLKTFGEKAGSEYIDIVRNIFSVLKKSGFSVAYKPHPFELGALYCREFGPVYKESLRSAFSKFDVFISLTSTALFEATVAGRVAIQIEGSSFASDDFSEVGYSHSIDYSSIEQLPGLVRELEPFSNEKLVALSTMPVVDRFREALCSI